MATYQKVPISQPQQNKRHRHSLESDSRARTDYNQPLQARTDYSSDYSNDSHSISSSSVVQNQPTHHITERNRHHRNRKHIQLNTNDLITTHTPSNTKKLTKPKFSISRRRNKLIQQTQNINGEIPYLSTNKHNITTLSTVPSEHQINVKSDLSLPKQLSHVQHSTDHTNDAWNYAYSYASSTVPPKSRYGEMDDHKTIESPNHNMMPHRPSLFSELKPQKHSMKISETQLHMFKPSLYTGFVTPNPIEIHNDLMRQPKLRGPVLMYRKIFDESASHLKAKKQLGYIPIFALPIQSVILNMDICLETAFIEMKIIFINNCAIQIKNALFAMPINDGNIRNVSATIQDDTNRLSRHKNNNSNKRFIQTRIIDEDEIEYDESDCTFDGIFTQNLEDFIPDLFRLPIAVIGKDDCIEICVKWEQSMVFSEGRYHLRIPLQFAHNILPNNVNLSEIIHINVILNSFMTDIKFGSNSHKLSIIKTVNNNSQTHLFAVPCEHNIESKDFHIAYYLQSDMISGNCIVAHDSASECGHFVLCINPMTDNTYITKQEIFGRDIIFLIDRSGSMSHTYSKVMQGLNNALDTLHKNDQFGIVCFNETQIYFHGNGQPNSPRIVTQTRSNLNIISDNNKGNKSEKNFDMTPPKCALFEANDEYIANAKQFIVNYGPNGATDIITPLKWSLNVLNSQKKKNRIAFVVLITDGSDFCEKEIINNLNSNKSDVRILTLGIGKFCNLYFLKLLSLLSRGWNDYAMYGSDIKSKIECLVRKSEYPILKDLFIENGITNNKYIELYPLNGQCINDIFLNGQSIVIYGRYAKNELIQILQTQTNNTIRVSAQSINDESHRKIYEFNVQYCNEQKSSDNMFSIPIQQICIKQQINELTSLFWFDERQRNIKQKIINLCRTLEVLSEYCALISVETTNNELRKYQSFSYVSSMKYDHKMGQSSKNNNGNIIQMIGATNKLFGNRDINHNICGIYDSVGQFITDEIHTTNNYCDCCCGCCCDDIFYKLKYFFHSLHCC